MSNLYAELTNLFDQTGHSFNDKGYAVYDFLNNNRKEINEIEKKCCIDKDQRILDLEAENERLGNANAIKAVLAIKNYEETVNSLKQQLHELPKKICDEIKNNIYADKFGIAVKLSIETIIDEIRERYEDGV